MNIARRILETVRSGSRIRRFATGTGALGERYELRVAPLTRAELAAARELEREAARKSWYETTL